MEFDPVYIELFKKFVKQYFDNHPTNSDILKISKDYIPYIMKDLDKLSICNGINKNSDYDYINLKHQFGIKSENEIIIKNDIDNCVMDIITDIYENKCKFYSFFNPYVKYNPYVFIKTDNLSITYYILRNWVTRDFINRFSKKYEHYLNIEFDTYSGITEYLQNKKFAIVLDDYCEKNNVNEYIITDILYNFCKINLIKNV